ncbi:MAG: Bug family tripartite tricarboxylate transporter substrate binding protein [Rubrivivax sp.]
MTSSANRRRVLRSTLIAGVAGLTFASGSAFAQDWPSRPVRVVIPFAPGGSADVYGRFVAERLQSALGQNFVVENKAGGGSVIGTDAVAKSAPDGHTLLVMSNTHTVNETLLPKKPFKLMDDFVAVAPLTSSDLVLVARKDLPASTIGDILKAAKAKPDGMTYASSGPGTPYHMAGELLKAMAGVSIVHVPYKGSAGARTDVLGGQVDMMFDAIPTMSAHVASGKVKAVAVSGKVASPILPGVPTVDQAGVPGYTATIWLGVMAPKGTPQAVVDKLNTEIAKITRDAQVQSAWAKQGTDAVTMSVREFDTFLRGDIAKWADVVKKAGIKVD